MSAADCLTSLWSRSVSSCDTVGTPSTGSKFSAFPGSIGTHTCMQRMLIKAWSVSYRDCIENCNASSCTSFTADSAPATLGQGVSSVNCMSQDFCSSVNNSTPCQSWGERRTVPSAGDSSSWTPLYPGVGMHRRIQCPSWLCSRLLATGPCLACLCLEAAQHWQLFKGHDITAKKPVSGQTGFRHMYSLLKKTV